MKSIIGLDIGGSKISGIVFDGKKAVKVLTVKTPKNLQGFRQSLKQMIVALSPAVAIKATGAGIPGAIDGKGEVVYAPNMKFLVGFNLKKFLGSLGLKKIAIENDANCFSVAEAVLGQGRRLKNFIGITLGTGIGGGLISNRKLYGGLHGSAGEVGHLMADSGHTYEYYFQKHRRARNYIKIGFLLGRLIADVVNVLDIEAIILGGAVTSAAKKFLPSMIKEAKKHILNKKIRPKIKISKLKHAGALGAALLFRS